MLFFFYNQYYKIAYSNDESNTNLPLNLACCYIYLGDNEEAQEIVKKGGQTHLKERILYLLSSKTDRPRTLDPKRVSSTQNAAVEELQDQLCMASTLYLNEKYSEACSLYEKLVEEYPFDSSYILLGGIVDIY